MKAIIAGSRDITDFNFVHKCILDTILKLHQERFKTIKTDSKEELNKRVWEGVNIITEVVSGTAKGVDRLGENWALENQLNITRFPADWDKYGKKAGYIRNKQMADYTGKEGILIAIWDGKSRGTKMMIDIAKKKGIRAFIYKEVN